MYKNRTLWSNGKGKKYLINCWGVRVWKKSNLDIHPQHMPKYIPDGLNR